MTEVPFKNARMETGQLIIDIPPEQRGAVMKFLRTKKDKPYDLTIKEHRKKRSLDANAYMWQLLGELAPKLETTSEELYKHYVGQYGIFKDFLLTDEEGKTFIAVWEKQGLGWPVERLDFAADGDRIIYRAYYGTSVYTSTEISRVIDAIVTDAKEAGI